MINPREFIRRLIKVLILLTISFLSLHNIKKLNNEDILVTLSIITITYVILDTMTPSIEIKRSE